MVPYSAQVQRLMRSALDEAQRARTHILPFPPEFWIAEPGDIGSWTSVRNGYVDKSFRVDAITDKYNLDVIMHVTEVDPADYDWNHTTDFQGFPTGPTVFPRPSPQGIVDWFAEPYTIKDADGGNRRPAIRLSWDGTMPGVSGVAFAVRNKSDQVVVHRGRTDYLSAGAIIISQNLLPGFQYQAQGQYIPSWPRDVLPSDWLDVTTPDVRLSYEDFDSAVKKQVTEITDYLNDKIDAGLEQMSALVSQVTARTDINKKEVRTQLYATAGTARADIEEVRTVAVSTQDALAAYEITVSASFGTVNSSITANSNAIATLDGYAAAAYGVTLDVNGYATGFQLFNGGSSVSSFTVTVDKFQVSAPGVAGGAAVPIFTVANVNGVAKVALRGDMYVDGSITTQTIAAGAITTIKLDAQAVTAAKIQAGSITSDSGVIGALSVKSLSIGDNAVTVTRVQTTSTELSGDVSTINVSVDTTGLAGKTVTVLATLCASIIERADGGGFYADTGTLKINGGTVMSLASVVPTAGMNLSGAYDYVASGGIDTITVVFNFNGGSGNSTISKSVLAVNVVKR